MSTISEAYAAAVESFHAGDVQRAEGICRQINQVAPEYADAWYFRGLVNYSLGKPAIAIDYLRRALALSPDDEEAHNNLGVILCDLGQLDEAIASLQRAVELRPDYSDAQNNLGVAMKANGELDKAVECYRRAMQLTPDYGEAHLNLGGVLIAQGKLDEAVDCYRQVMRIDPGNSIAAHMLAACTGAAVPDRASDQYVRNTFDKSAGRFNQALQRLNYQAPRLVTEALAREIPEPSSALDILDAGCGAGLCGPLLRPYANHLVGMDLSPGMLRQAARTDVYDALVEAELVGFMSERAGAFDAIVSVDTLVYFGGLEQALAAAANALRPRGCLVFTLERATNRADHAGFYLQSSGRYRHSQIYVERTFSGGAHRLQFRPARTEVGCIDFCGFRPIPARVGETDRCRNGVPSKVGRGAKFTPVGLRPIRPGIWLADPPAEASPMLGCAPRIRVDIWDVREEA